MEKETRDLITLNESTNEGKSIYLYFNYDVGYYTAYGFSAFLISHVVDPVCSFSDTLQLPVALVNKSQIFELRRSLHKVRHVEHSFYEFELRLALGTDGYDRWIESLK